MKKIEVSEILDSVFPGLKNKIPSFLYNLSAFFFASVFKLNEINRIIAANTYKYDFDFIDELFEYLDFNYYISGADKMKIPSEGKLIIVANHPLGGLDGLALLRAVSEIRQDVTIVANEVLNKIDNLKHLFIPVSVFSGTLSKQSLGHIDNALRKEQVIILFPASEVSRLSMKGIRDRRWSGGAVKLAKKHKVPILPVKIEGRNSFIFYLLSVLNKIFATVLLPRELFKQKNKSITLRAGNLIPADVFKNANLKENTLTGLLRKHLYGLPNKNKELFITENAIIHPVSKKVLKLELMQNELIGRTGDDKKIYLVEYSRSKNILREISRLREITFRKVGEGTGNKSDIDRYDQYYKHIVLWDDENLEIAGAYRLGVCRDILEQYGRQGLYNSVFFEFDEKFDEVLKDGIEVGRSFIQQKYWGTNALDYLWQGIGAFLNHFPYRYLIGAVSISDSYPEEAKKLIITYYDKWYGFGSDRPVKAKNKYFISRRDKEMIASLLNGKTPDEDFKLLKTQLKAMGFSVPVLLKKYTDVTEYGGARYMDFGIDPSFGNSIDCFITVDLASIKPEFEKRYLKGKNIMQEA